MAKPRSPMRAPVKARNRAYPRTHWRKAGRGRLLRQAVLALGWLAVLVLTGFRPWA